MFGFLALVWAEQQPVQAAMAAQLTQAINRSFRGWQQVLSVPGVALYQRSTAPDRMQTYPLDAGEQGTGVVLGRLFRRDGAPAAGALRGTLETEKLLLTGGQHLIDKYWGRYVAFLVEKPKRCVSVLRAPLGSLPCYIRTVAGVNLLFSQVEYLDDLPLPSPSVDMTMLARYLCFAFRQHQATLFTDIKELLPGQRCRFANDVVETDFLWKPNAIALEEPIEEQVEAANRLRQSTLESVSAWAGGYERILHRLSGGLDSSIVLAALMRAESRPQITCLNYFTSGRDGDERHFARLMAEHAGVPLVEFAADEAKVEMNMLDRLRRTIRPMNVLIEQARAAPERALIRDAGLQACFFGAGGDNIFFQPHTALGAIDHALRHGLRHGFMDRVLEAARLERRSLWSVLGRTLWAQLPGQSPNPFPTYGMSPDKALIHPDVYQAAGQLDVTHPWMHEGLEKLPPGKIMHIHMMTAPPSYYEALADPADFLEPVHPLFSQPLVETCIRIPVYTMTLDGRSRGLARRAFADLLPARIAGREAKGAAGSFFNSILTRNLPFIRAYLLDGLLLQHGLLDRARLEAALSSHDVAADGAMTAVLLHLGTESWLRSWSSASNPLTQGAPS